MIKISDKTLNAIAAYAWGVFWCAILTLFFSFVLWMPALRTFIVIYATAWVTHLLKDDIGIE